MLYFINTTMTQAKLQQLLKTHPYLLLAFFTLGMPLAILGGVVLAAFGIILPISFVMGWT